LVLVVECKQVETIQSSMQLLPLVEVVVVSTKATLGHLVALAAVVEHSMAVLVLEPLVKVLRVAHLLVRVAAVVVVLRLLVPPGHQAQVERVVLLR
jgi:3-oxoacyl-(acyl-carrier-protein) synthase